MGRRFYQNRDPRPRVEVVRAIRGVWLVRVTVWCDDLQMRSSHPNRLNDPRFRPVIYSSHATALGDAVTRLIRD